MQSYLLCQKKKGGIDLIILVTQWLVSASKQEGPAERQRVMTFNFKIVSVNDTESSLDHLHQQDETCAAVTFSFLMNANSFPVSLTLTQSYSMFTTNLLTVQSFSSHCYCQSVLCS